MKQIGVIGGGIMGSGIAQVFAQKGYRVGLIEASPKLCEKAKTRIQTSIQRGIEKKTLTLKDKKNILKNISFLTDLTSIKKAQLAIEAIPEKVSLKKKLFKQLDTALQPMAILTSNTSSISISELAQSTQRPSKVIGMHFMNPVPAMPLVEIVRGKKTSSHTLRQIKQLGQKLGKTCVVAQDAPGFISNRILVPMVNEAIFCLQEKIGTKEDIDTVMKLGMHHPMGPLELADFIGLDTLLEISEILHKGFKNPKYRPPKLLKEMVKKKKLGKKTGLGFYRYNKLKKK